MIPDRSHTFVKQSSYFNILTFLLVLAICFKMNKKKLMNGRIKKIISQENSIQIELTVAPNLSHRFAQ